MKVKSVSSYITSLSVFFITLIGFSSAQGKTFFEVIETALMTNPNILSQKEVSRAERYGINSVRGEYLPSIDLTGGVGRENTDTASINDKDLTRKEARVALSQLIFDGNSVWSRYNQQTARYRSSKYDLEDQQINISLRSIEAYLDTVKSREVARMALSNEQEHVLTLDKVKQLYAGGAGRGGDINLAEGRLAQTRATLTRLENNVKDADANFEAVIGEALTYKVSWPQSAESTLPSSLDEAIDIALKSNPGLLSSRESSRVTHWAIKDSRSTFWPKINVEASATRNNDLDGTEGKNNDTQVMLKASWNILNGGSDIARYKQSVHRHAEANENINNTRRNLIESVTRSWNQYHSAVLRQEQLRKHMITSREVLDAYEEQFKFGQRQLFNVLDQKNELFDSKVNFVNGRDEVIRSGYQILAQIGTLANYVTDQRNKEVERAEETALRNEREAKQREINREKEKIQEHMHKHH